MPFFTIRAIVPVDCYTVVEAGTKEQAIQEALQRDLCGQFGTSMDSWLGQEVVEEPEITEVEET